MRYGLKLWKIKGLIYTLSKIKECQSCHHKYLPKSKWSKVAWSKSRFCSRKCQHISQRIEFKDGRFNGKNNPFYGKKHKKDAIEKNRIKHFGIMEGSKHWNWKGGSSFAPYPIGWTQTYREQIRYRDKYTCQICGIPESECSRKLHVHHIDYNKINLSLDNLISLCMSCHLRTNYRIEYWKTYFNKIKENKNESSLASDRK